MDSFREKLSTEELSEESVILVGNSWCGRRKIYPIRCPLRSVVQFLMECFQYGFKYNTIAGFRSAISVSRDLIRGISVRKHPRVSDLLTSIFNKNSPQPKFNFMWDVKKAINFLSSQRFETNVSLKDLTLK